MRPSVSHSGFCPGDRATADIPDRAAGGVRRSAAFPRALLPGARGVHTRAEGGDGEGEVSPRSGNPCVQPME
jgi:hypothetical protein